MELWVMVLFYIDCILLGKCPNVSLIQFYHLKNGDAIFQDSCED